MDPQLDARLDRLEKRIASAQSVIQLVLMASGGSLPITSVATVFSGNRIGTSSKYLELYTNNYPRLVALKVAASFAVGASDVNLSLQNSDNGIVSTLSKFGEKTTGTIWLPPNKSLYINSLVNDGTLDGSSFRVLLFDPLSFTVS